MLKRPVLCTCTKQPALDEFDCPQSFSKNRTLFQSGACQLKFPPLLYHLWLFSTLFLREIIHPFVTSHQQYFYKIPNPGHQQSLANGFHHPLGTGLFARCDSSIVQLHNETKYKKFPHWLDRWMVTRKQFGLLSFFFAAHMQFTVYPIRWGYPTDISCWTGHINR